MRRLSAGADPDAPPREVTMPACWQDSAAEALAALAPGRGRATLAEAADAWIGPIAAAAGAEGAALAEHLHRLLLLRRGTPDAQIWRGETPVEPGFVLNLPAFHDPADGFDVAGFADAVRVGVIALSLAAPEAPRLRVGMADLSGLLAALGLDYRGAPARGVAACLAAVLRGHAAGASAALAARFGARASSPGWPDAPAFCVVPGLAEAARAARDPARPLRHAALTAIDAPGAPEALLGVASGGIAPAFSPLDQEGGLSQATRAWMAANDLSAEAALAAMLRGENRLPMADAAAHVAMHDAVAPFMEAMPARPLEAPGGAPGCAQGREQGRAMVPAGGGPARRELPSRRAGYTQKAAVGGHRLFLKTGEYADGSLGEMFVMLPRDGAALRGLMDSFAAAVSLGLQHGVPLDAFVDAFIGTRDGGGGAVEGDPAVRRADSLVDYVFRHLAVHYLGRADLPEAESGPDAEAADEAMDAPLLPMALPAEATARQRRRSFRVVGR